MDHALGDGSCLTVLTEMASLDIRYARSPTHQRDAIFYIGPPPILKHLLRESSLRRGAGVAQGRAW
jgi:hypothetical protein